MAGYVALAGLEQLWGTLPREISIPPWDRCPALQDKRLGVGRVTRRFTPGYHSPPLQGWHGQAGFYFTVPR